MPFYTQLSLLSLAYAGGQRELLQMPDLPLTLNQFCYPTGICNPSELSNGVFGFSLSGNQINDNSGYSVSTAGDLDGDGNDDILIGAPSALGTGVTYVVYGNNQSGAFGNGKLSLSNLMNGQSGFSLQGIAAADSSGRKVTTAGDFNSDSYSDILITSPGAGSVTGQTHLLFGDANRSTWDGVLNLNTTIDGTRGLTFIGEGVNAYSGWDVAGIGDFDGDSIPDFAITQPNFAGIYPNNVFVVFGNESDIWGNGQFNLSSLDGRQGFILQGTKKNDHFGNTVAAGNMNGDRFSDLIIAAPGYADAGGAYVLLGNNRSFWANGTYNISHLINGQRGFVFKGQTAGDGVGLSLATVPNLNGNGLSTLFIGAPNADGMAGKIYGIFGTPNTTTWGSTEIDLGNVTDGTRGFVIRGTSEGVGQVIESAGDVNGDGLGDVFIPKTFVSTTPYKTAILFGSNQTWNKAVLYVANLTDGHLGFTLQGATASSIGVADAGDVNGDGVGDVIIGARSIDSFKGQSYVIFGAQTASAHFINNTLKIAAERTILFTTDNLNIATTYLGLNISSIDVNFEQVTNGYFSYVSVSAPIVSCTIQDIQDGKIVFVHNGKQFPPSYRVRFQIGPLSYFSDADIKFLGYPPTLLNNKLSVNQGQNVTVTPNDFGAEDQDSNSRELSIIINNLTHGEFLLNNQSTNEFTLQELSERRVMFVPDGTDQAPSGFATVTDGKSLSSPQEITFTFNQAPKLTVSSDPIILDQGAPTILRVQDFIAHDRETFQANLIFYASVSSGYLAYASNLNYTIVEFLALSLTTQQIAYVHPGDTSLPNVSFRVSDGILYSELKSPTFRLNHRPVLVSTMEPQSVVQDETFYFSIPTGLFQDIDVNSTLKYSANLVGGAPLPEGIVFTPPGLFSGASSELGNLEIEITAEDERGLKASTSFSLSTDQSNFDKMRPNLNIFGSVFGSLTAVLAYLWVRRRMAKHRSDFTLADDLRTTNNLEYYDFSRFDGDTFKTHVQSLLLILDMQYRGFYNSLNDSEKKSFAVCLSEILTTNGYISKSEPGARMFSFMCCLNHGHPSQLNLKAFETDLLSIATQAITAWETAKANGKDVSKVWLYFKPTKRDRLYTFFGCQKPFSEGRWIVRDDIELARRQAPEDKNSDNNSPNVERQLELLAKPVRFLEQGQRSSEENKLEVVVEQNSLGATM